MTVPVPDLLYTDVLLWGLAGAAAWLLWRNRASGAVWRRVLQRPSAMAAAVVLLAFVLIGLADSLHFRPAGVLVPESVLDLALAPLERTTERSYSSPLAVRALDPAPVRGADRRPALVRPRLVHGGSGLADPDRDRLADIARRTGEGLAAGLAMTLAVAATVTAALRRRCGGWRPAATAVLSGAAGFPARALILSTGGVCTVAAVLTCLAAGYHVLGTDKVGQDVFCAALKSVRTGLVIGTLTTLVTLPLSLTLGVAAGYCRGRVDDAVQYVYTTLNSVPDVLLIAAAALILEARIDAHPDAFGGAAGRADLRLLCLCLILGLTRWTGLCRLLRAETMKLRELDYVQAAIGLGQKPAAILLRHILPNVMHLVIISITLDFSGLVLSEAVLSYIGIGVDPTTFSWGNMINAARLELSRAPVVWWNLGAAFFFMFALVMAANLLADAVQQALDPHGEEGK